MNFPILLNKMDVIKQINFNHEDYISESLKNKTHDVFKMDYCLDFNLWLKLHANFRNTEPRIVNIF